MIGQKGFLMRNALKFAVLGAGRGGHAMAADLTLAGHVVNLFNRSPAPIETIIKNRGIEITGEVTKGGLVELNKATTDMREAMEKDVDIVMITVPAFGQQFMVEKCAQYLRDGQILIYNTGNFASLALSDALKKCAHAKDVKVAETDTLIYATRIIGPGRSFVIARKKRVLLATLPSGAAKEVLRIVNEAYPEFVLAANVFETSFSNMNSVFHPAPMILNASRIEQFGSYKYSHFDATPSVGRVMEAVDSERLAVGTILGLEPISAREMLTRSYDAKGETFYETLLDWSLVKQHMGPPGLNHRYITEDVPYSLVPIASLAETLSVPTPTIKSLIQIASVLNQSDYWHGGRTVEKLKLKGLSAKEMIEYVT